MTAGTNRHVMGVVLAGAHPWDEPQADNAFLRPLAPVAHLPLIGYVLHWLADGGVGRATICANGESRFVRHCLWDGKRLGVGLDYYEDRMPRGPAGCVLDATAGTQAEVFVVADGTIIPQFDLEKLLRHHAESGATATVVVSGTERHAPDGAGRSTPIGIYVFSRRALEFVGQSGYQDTKEMLIPDLYANGERVVCYEADSPCPRVTDAATYLAVNEWRLDQLVGQANPMPGYRAVGESCVHHTARVSLKANLIGPVLIGPNTRVSREATLVGPTVVGADCEIRTGAVASRSVIWDRCVLGGGSVVDRCILKNGAEVRPDTKLSRAVRGPVRRNGTSRWSGLAWWRKSPKAGNGRSRASHIHGPLREARSDSAPPAVNSAVVSAGRS